MLAWFVRPILLLFPLSMLLVFLSFVVGEDSFAIDLSAAQDRGLMVLGSRDWD